mmetsp:Transcript_15232/g.41242  ORF Transcript_15232/g.41242 Transcript_15232/m.41242 type:complete len:225 (-) Transcript_15232:624-1298(-)
MGGVGRHEQGGLELHITLSLEVHPAHGVGIVLGDGLVELLVLLIGDILGLAQPDSLAVIQQLPLVTLLLASLLGGLLGLLILALIISHLLIISISLGLALVCLLLLLFLLNGHINLLLGPQVDGEVDELGVLVHQLAQLGLLGILLSLGLQVDVDHSSAADVLSIVLSNGEVSISSGLPDVLLVIVVLGNDLHPVGHKVHGVETHTKLTNQVDIPTLLHLLQEA